MITPTRQSPRLTFMLLMITGTEAGRRIFRRISRFPPPKERISLISSWSVWEKLVYRVMTDPNTATETAATTMVFKLAPSHTMRRGAMADLGRLFNMTR